MFVYRRWRRRLQALLGRGMADDGPSACPTVNIAGTPRSPRRAATRRDAIGRRAIRHAIRRWTIPHAMRRRAIPHATTIPHAVSGTSSSSHATRPTARDPAPAPFARDDHDMSGYAWNMPGICSEYARKCPDYVRTMFGYS